MLRITLLNLFFLSHVLFIKAQGGSAPISLTSGHYLIQTGTFNVPSNNITNMYQALGSGSGQNIYAVNLVTARPSFKAGLGIKKMDFGFNLTGFTFHLLTEINFSSSTALFVKVASTPGNSLYELELSYIVIDATLQNVIYIQLYQNNFNLNILQSGPPLAFTVSHTFAGFSSVQTKKMISLNQFNLQPQNPSFQIGLDLQLISIDSTTVNLSLIALVDTFVNQFSMSILYFNPYQLLQKDIYKKGSYVPVGPTLSITSTYNLEIYTITLSCPLITTNVFFGMRPTFNSFGKISFELSFANSLASSVVSLNANSYFYYNFLVFSFCTQSCGNLYPFLFIDGNCYDVCPFGYFGNLTSFTCQICQLNCSSCDISSTNCTSCVNGTFLDNFLCGTTCPNTTYGDISVNQCLNCTGTCLNCQNSATNCTSCINSTFYLSFQCYYICPPPYYGDNGTGLCANCPTHCLNCSSLSQCFSCQAGWFLSDFMCVMTCPNTTYGNNIFNQCLNCTGTCQFCDFQSNNCTKCINNTYYLNFDCSYNCPLSYYGNQSTGNCQKCFLNCQICSQSSICQKCTSNTFLQPNFDRCSMSCPSNYFPNITNGNCQQIVIQGCVSGLYLNAISICLQCNITANFMYDPKTRKCVCKIGYKLNNGLCSEICGDGIVQNMACDDGNFMNRDGCSSKCIIESDFRCLSVPNGPTLTSKCTYLSDINIQILSQTKFGCQNTLKLILNLYPTPDSLTAKDIKNFLKMQIANQTIDMSSIEIIYQDGITQIFVPYTQDIEGKILNLQTNYDQNKYASINTRFQSIIEGDNIDLLYSENCSIYQNLGYFSFSISIFVCIVTVLSFYKHKMIGLQLILPFQVIFYSQSFYSKKAMSASLYTSFKPVSFSVFTPNQMNSKGNALYKIGMTGGFLQNYNLLGIMFVVSALILIVSMFRMQEGQTKRFTNKKALKDWIKFAQFRLLIEKYEAVIWKGFFVFFCLSTIPLIFAIPSQALTQSSNEISSDLLSILNAKFTYIFVLLFLFGLFYTSIPKIFYNNSKNFLKKHIFKQEGLKFNYSPSYCMYFQLHYLSIGCVLAFCHPSLIILYVLSGINGIFFLYLLIVRPYESVIDNIGAILSNLIVVYYFTINLIVNINESAIATALLNLSGFMIIFLLVVEIIIAIIRMCIFYRLDQPDSQKNLKQQKRFKYVRDKAFNKLTKEEQNVQINRLMKKCQPHNCQLDLAQIIQKTPSKKTLNHHSYVPSFMNQKFSKPQQQQYQHSSLSQVKKRLRQNLLQQRQINNQQIQDNQSIN